MIVTAHWMTPEEIRERDRLLFGTDTLGNVSTRGYLAWCRSQIEKAKQDHPEWFTYGNLVQHNDYIAWLTAQYGNALCGETVQIAPETAFDTRPTI